MAETAEFEIKYKYAGESELRRAKKDLDNLRKTLDNAKGKISASSALGSFKRLPPYSPTLGGPRASHSILSNARPGKRIAPPEMDALSYGPKKQPGFMGELFGQTRLGSLGKITGILFAAELAAKALSTAFDFVKFSVETVVGSIFKLSSALVSTMAHFVDFSQRSKLAFGSLLDSPEVGAQAFDDVRKMAQDLGLEVEDTVDSYRKLLAAQFSVQDATNLTKATADLQALGASADDVKHALLAISQIKMKGKLQAEELTRQLANAGVSSELVYQEIEKSLFGKHDKETRKKVLAMQQSGDISAQVAIPAIMEAIKRKAHEKELGEVSLKFANEKVGGMLQQTVGMFKNAFIDIAALIEEPITRAAKVIFTTIKSIASSSVVQQIKERLGGVFVAAADFVMQSWPMMQPVIVGVLQAISSNLQILSDFINNNGPLIREKITAIAGAFLVIGLVMVNVTLVTLKFIDTITSALSGLGRFADKLRETLGPLYYVGRIASIFLPGGGLLNAGIEAGQMINQGKDALGGFATTASLGAGVPGREEGLGGVLAGIDARRSGISPLGDSITQKSIGTVNNTINVTPVDFDDPNGVGGKILEVVNKGIHKSLDEGT